MLCLRSVSRPQSAAQNTIKKRKQVKAKKAYRQWNRVEKHITFCAVQIRRGADVVCDTSDLCFWSTLLCFVEKLWFCFVMWW